MKKSLFHFHYRGIPGSIHWTFLLVLTWFIIANILTGFHENGWIWSLIMLLSLFASILIHDLSQALVGMICRIKISRLILLPIGCLPTLAAKPQRKIYEFVMLAAGPFANLVIAALLLLFLNPYKAYWDEPENVGVAYAGNFLFQLQFINLSLGLLNLLPCFPMDGGRALDALIENKYSVPKAKKIVMLTSLCIAVAFFAAGIVYLNYQLLMIAFFILITARQGKYYHAVKSNTTESFSGVRIITSV